MRTANPALRDEVFDVRARSNESTMTIMGAVHKTGTLILLVLVTAVWIWNKFPPVMTEVGGGMADGLTPWLIGGSLGGLVSAFVVIFNQRLAPVLAPVYALCEGVVLGGLSAAFEARYPGIAFQAMGLTAGTLIALLVAYRSGLIKATENFKLGVVAATGAIALVYLLDIILSFFGIHVPFIHESGVVGIGISVVIVVVAALNLVLDFDFIEQGAERGAPKYMEWYAAFGLLVTLVWLYLEILRLLAKVHAKK